ncbi:MAG: hypothetical protein IIT65_04980 [Lachnospiraceae bacterium]|nr:hypothetical protein [Lachnospiraceae bacterium]
MKLRNKKTGEVIDVLVTTVEYPENCQGQPVYNFYDSLTELNNELEDYEETKEYWCIDWTGGINHITVLDDVDEYEENKKEIGNYFDTREEAEKAVEKLKAWKRLKDIGFHFLGWNSTYKGDNVDFYLDWINSDSKEQLTKDLELLFGDEK